MAAKLSKESVNYRKAKIAASKRCGLCSMFREPKDCTLVEGYILRSFVCDRFAKKGQWKS